MSVSTKMIEAMAIWAEVEGMKAKNRERESEGMAQAWPESCFEEKAEELRNLAARHEDQL